jgi:hypothetical protein
MHARDATLTPMHLAAYLAFGFLYLMFLTGSLRALFPRMPGSETLRRLRPIFGIAALLCAAVHAYLAFFVFIGGFHGLRYWTIPFRISLLWGLLALLLLAVLSLAAVPSVRRMLGRRLPGMAYAAGLLVLVHGTTVTVHVFPLWLIFAVAYPFLLFLLALEAVRADRWLSAAYPLLPRHVAMTFGLPAAAAILTWSFFFVNHHTN